MTTKDLMRELRRGKKRAERDAIKAKDEVEKALFQGSMETYSYIIHLLEANPLQP